MIGELYTGWQILQGIRGLIGADTDFPKLKNEQGEWLPLYYTKHNRASITDLEKVWVDKHTICDAETGVPVARWSYGNQDFQQVTGFTIQGFPVYSQVDPNHPVWTTIRPSVPAEYGSPGYEGEVLGHKGGGATLRAGMLHPYPAVKGEKLAAYLGYYGPLEMPVGETPETGDTPPVQNIGPGLLTIGGIVALAMGATVPGALALGAGILLNRGTPQTPQRSRGGPGVGGTTPGGGNITQGRG